MRVTATDKAIIDMLDTSPLRYSKDGSYTGVVVSPSDGGIHLSKTGNGFMWLDDADCRELRNYLNDHFKDAGG